LNIEQVWMDDCEERPNQAIRLELVLEEVDSPSLGIPKIGRRGRSRVPVLASNKFHGLTRL
jgi:hypothetical protein